MNLDHQEFATLLHRCAALWRVRLDERLRPWGMTQSTWRILWVMRQAGRRYNQRCLADRLGIETPTLVRIIDRMEKLGLLRREPDSRDRRQKYIAVTEQGLALADEIEGEVVGMRQQMLAGLDSDQLAAGIAVLRHVLGNAGVAAGVDANIGADSATPAPVAAD